jgi:broad specificity phosphatase PhoE
LRTSQTAEIVNRQGDFYLEIIYDKRLREIGLGKHEGVTKESDLRELYIDPEKHGLELPVNLYNRVCDFLNSIQTTDDIIIVSHGAIMHMFNYVYNEKEFSFRRFAKLVTQMEYKNAEVLQLDFSTQQ